MMSDLSENSRPQTSQCIRRIWNSPKNRFISIRKQAMSPVTFGEEPTGVTNSSRKQADTSSHTSGKLNWNIPVTFFHDTVFRDNYINFIRQSFDCSVLVRLRLKVLEWWPRTGWRSNLLDGLIKFWGLRSQWMEKSQDRSSWNSLGEAYALRWTSICCWWLNLIERRRCTKYSQHCRQDRR